MPKDSLHKTREEFEKSGHNTNGFYDKFIVKLYYEIE